MEFSLILIGLAVVIAVFLIFKLIKKLIFAILAVILVIVLAVAAVAGLIYADFNYLSSQEDFKVNLVVANGDFYLYGLQIPFENKEPIQDKVKGISNDLKDFKPEDVTDKDSEFDIVIQKATLENLIDGKIFDFNELIQAEDFKDYNLEFTDKEIIKVLNSNNPETDFLNVVFNKVDLPDYLKELARPLAQEALNKQLSERNVDVKEVLFSLVLLEVAKDETKTLSLIQAFQEEDIKIYPDRLLFSIVRAIPADSIQTQIDTAIPTQ